MVFGSGLDVPNITLKIKARQFASYALEKEVRTSVTPELSTLQSVGDSVFVADRTTSSVN
jgi:hypothetical protein